MSDVSYATSQQGFAPSSTGTPGSWSSYAPYAATIGGSAIATSANTTGAQVAGAGVVQGAQITADAIYQAQLQVQYYSEQAKAYVQAGNLQAAQQLQAYAEAALQTVQNFAVNAPPQVKAYAAQALQTVQQFSDAAKTAIVAANDKAIATQKAQQDQTVTGVSYLRGVVANPGDLTPQQQQQLADSRLSTANMIHSSDFAGSGRSAAALLNRSESDTVNAMLEANRQRAMTAAGELAPASFQAGNTITGIQTGQGAQIAGIDTSTGNTGSGIIQNTGNTLTGIAGGAADRSTGILTNTGAGLAGFSSNTGNSISNIDTTTGTNTGNMTAKIGQVQGDAAAKANLYTAQADIANGQVQGKALGDISSLITSQSRLGRYG